MVLRTFRRIHGYVARVPGGYWRFSALNFLFWAMMVSNMYITVYLREQGFSALEIGSMTAAFTVVNVVAPVFFGAVADKLRSVKLAFVLCVAVSAVIWVLLPHAVRWISPVTVLISLPLYRFFNTPASSLLDAWVMGGINRDRRLNYGSIRLWGSIGYAIVAVACGEFFKCAPLDLVFYAGLIFALPCAFIAFGAKEEGRGPAVPLREMRFGRILRNGPLAAFLLFMLILFIPINATGTFLPYLLQSAGGQDAYIGTILGLRAVAEIPAFIFSAYALRRFKTTNLILICSVFFGLEVFLFAFCGTQFQVLLLQCLHGAVYGLFLSCQVSYIDALAPKGLSATAQTFAGCATAVSGIAGNLIGGAVIQFMDIETLFIGSGALTMLAVAVYWVCLRVPTSSV